MTKYKWKVNYVNEGQFDMLDYPEKYIGEHEIIIKLSSSIEFFSKEVNDFLKKNKIKNVYAHNTIKNRQDWTYNMKKSVNTIMIRDLKKDSDDKKEVEKIMKLIPKLHKDPKYRAKRKLIEEIKNRKGQGVI